MDSNKDDALKCFRIAREAFESGDKNRAHKFINKARRLDPSLPIDDLLSKIVGESPADTEPVKESPDSSEIPGNGSSGGGGVKRRVSANGSKSGSSSAATSSVAYTEEQVAIVREIRRKKDYYDVLGVEKSCSVEDVRKAYRKLSLKVHPDKNKAPGSDEAFKTVSKAFQCLSDEEGRKRYDLVGSDEEVYERRTPARRGGGQGFNGFYEAEFDADEIFRNFFYGGMNPAVRTQFGGAGFSFGPGFGAGAGPRMAEQGSAGFNMRTLIQLLPVLLIILMNFLPSSEPIYSLSRSYSHDYKFTTQKGVNFYVRKSNFEQDYPPNSRQRVVLEQEVERDYVSVLSYNCRQEMQHLYWGGHRKTPNCDALKQFQAVA